MFVRPLLVVWFVFFLSFLDPLVGMATQPSEPHVVLFSPQGTVKDVRQVRAQFSAPMVPLGDPHEVKEPFTIACPEPGTGRWVDSQNWVYDFARDLPGGILCTFRLRPEMTTLAGERLGGQHEFSFSTGGPAIRSHLPYETIAEDQAFVLVLDAEATVESILAHASFSVEGIPERVGARLITGEERAAILQAVKWQLSPGPVIVLQARQRFPNKAKVMLVWGAGIAATSGVATEQDQVLLFTVRDAFLAEFHCEREKRDAPCLPVTSMRLSFSAPVPLSQARRISLTGRQGRRRSPEPVSEETEFVQAVTFKGPFPEESTFHLEVPGELRDDAGRSLLNAAKFPLTVKTGPFPPLAKFSSRFGIIEWKADPTLPVTLRNLEPDLQTRVLTVTREAAADKRAETQPPPEQARGKVWRVPPGRAEEILPWLRSVAVAKRDTSVFAAVERDRPLQEFTLPKPNGPRAFEVVGIPLREPGLYIVELESARLGAALLGKSRPMYVPTAALVTNLAVHLKWGREAALAWVTTLDSAQPVRDARVSVHDCHGKTLWRGETDHRGIARIEGLPHRDDLPSCPWANDAFEKFYDFSQIGALRNLDAGMLVIAQTADDLSFVHSGWDDGIEPWRFELPYESEHGQVVAHTIFDRSLFRAGETVHMKHILRGQTPRGFSLVSDNERPTRVVIRHLGSNENYELPLRWDATGSAESLWPIPKEAKLGRYDVMLVRPAAMDEFVGPVRPGEAEMEDLSSLHEQEWLSGEFRVEEFRVPLMRGTVQLPAEPQIAVTEVPVDLSVQYLAGGPAGRLPVTLRTQVRSKETPTFEPFVDFTFANGSVKEGIQQRVPYGEEENEETAGAPVKTRPAVHQRLTLELDAAGTAHTAVTELPKTPALQELLAELEFRDPNGEVQTVTATTPLWPALWLVGIKTENWAATKKSLATQIAVVDVTGEPIANAPVQVALLERKVYSHRKRLVGGFYAYEHREETQRVGEFCRGKTDAAGLFACEGDPPVEGNVILQASVTDKAGNTASAHREVWVVGSQPWWFRVEDSDRMDLLPEKRRYEPGEAMRLQVRMPFRAATALVAVERDGGILDAFVVPLVGQEPVIEIPANERYAPNVFVSVLAVRGRVGGVQPTALVDLGKPAFKLGVAEVRVGWRAYELKVRVSPDRSVYHVRERARVKIAAWTADGDPPPAGSEVAVAAVDEGLLELLPNPSWNLLEAMMGRRGYGVENATAQMQVVGKRHYGLKALPQGGGGGRQTTRELFDTLLLWQGRVQLDSRGETVVDVPLNDSLTSFCIVAVATGGTSLFGTGAATIRTTQDLMILAGISPVVRDGDQFQAEFTVRNTTSRAMEVVVNARVEGLPDALPPQTMRLSPGEAAIAGWTIVAPAGVDTLWYRVEANGSGGAHDQIQVSQRVRPAVPVQTVQATLFRWERETRQPVERPADAIPDRGGIRFVFSPTLAGSLDGIQERMRRYPYTCLEQKVSRAVALRDEQLWREITSGLPSYMDTDGLLKYFPTMEWGSEILTAYVLAIAHEAGWTLPQELLERMQNGLERFINGAILRRSAVQAADLSLRKLTALEALARYGRAEAGMLGGVTIEPTLWPTSALLDWWSVLRRVAGIPDQDGRLREVEQLVRARLNLQGTAMGFSTEQADALWWLMVSPDVNAVRLVLLLLEQDLWREDLPRLMRGALARRQRGAWDSTPANAWGVLAVEKFVHTFEADQITGVTTASVAEDSRQIDWLQVPQGGDLLFSWPARRADLTVNHTGTGHPWVTVQMQAAIPLTALFSSGYRITKTWTPIEAREEGRWSRGDLVRVRLEIDAQADMTWVVVSDPIPAGASQVGSGLRTSHITTQGEEAQGSVWPAFEERSFEAFRAYYEFVPKGTFTVEYTIRLSQSGRFHMPATRVDALYAPEMFGELPNAAIEVQP